MSAIGLSSLTALKRHLLASGMQSGATYDTLIAQIGKGVGGLFDKLCNRTLAYGAGRTATFTGDRDHYYVNAYPILSVTKLETSDAAGTWTNQALTTISQQDDDAGWVYFGGYLGDFYTRVRITYSGGYWFDDTEDESGTKPTGATSLPDDLLMAFFLQCRYVWDAIDKVQVQVAQGMRASQSKYSPRALPEVETILKAYTRFQLS